MRKIKTLLFGVIIGVALGLWFGVNIGKNQPMWSNPFAEADVGRQLREKGGRALERGGEALDRQGESLQGKKQTP